MNIIKRMKARAIIYDAADRFGETPGQVRKSIETFIVETWKSKDLGARAIQRRLFPKGQPTPEEFVLVISSLAKGDDHKFS